MKLAIMQPYYFPYIGYWQLINAVERFVIYDDVNYIKGGWVNRNRLLINGEPAYITAPLEGASPFKRICDIRLQNSMAWQDKLVKMVDNTYRRAPCYSEWFEIIETLIRYDAQNLSDYLVHQLRVLASFIGIHTDFVVTSRCYENSELSGQERIIDICRREGAKIFINPQGGMSLYNQEYFAACGVGLKFILPSNVGYRQFSPVHVPWLSIIDVMMFNTKSQLQKLLNNYDLV